jgi:phosphoglycolate phosphatase-like HAD superfamily hydrolase
MSLDLHRIKALCFDVDGTLSDTDDQFVKNLLRVLKPFSFAFPGKDPRPFARKIVMKTETPGNYIYGLLDRLGIDHTISTLGDHLYRLGLGKADKPFLLITGVKEMLLQLHPHYKMAVVSARGGRSTQQFIDQFNLSQFFDCIATAQTCEHTKPFPDPIFWAAAQMGVSPNNCLMIGDTTVDIIAGKSAGAQTAAVLCGFGERNELHESGADIILDTTSMLPELLLSSNRSQGYL